MIPSLGCLLLTCTDLWHGQSGSVGRGVFYSGRGQPTRRTASQPARTPLGSGWTAACARLQPDHESGCEDIGRRADGHWIRTSYPPVASLLGLRPGRKSFWRVSCFFKPFNCFRVRPTLTYDIPLVCDSGRVATVSKFLYIGQTENDGRSFLAIGRGRRGVAIGGQERQD